MKDQHFTSRMFTCAGALMTISAILMAIGSKAAYGGVLLAAASCMFFTARSFRMAENRKVDETHQKEADQDE